MSSILEALRELEENRAPGTPTIEWPEEPGGLGRVATGLAVVAAVAGLGLAAFLWTRHTAVVVPVAAAPPPAAPPVRSAGALPPAAPAPALSPSFLDADPPRARLATRGPAPPALDGSERPEPAVAARPPRASAPRSAGEPRVEVAGIAYSAVAEQRAVTLAVNGARPVTLREGEAAGEVEVQLILPDRVYVRHAGQIFAVEAH